MSPDDPYRRLEVQHRRPDAAHPDRCRKLRLRGVAFALPPRGLRITPRFAPDGRARVELAGADPWPQTAALCRRAAKAMVGPVLVLDPDGAESLLADLMTLARRALLRQYDLSDDHVAELLSFAGDESPQWISDLLSWAQGLGPIGPVTAGPRRHSRRWWPLGRCRKGTPDDPHH